MSDPAAHGIGSRDVGSRLVGSRRGGSWPALLGLVVVFLLLFVVQRARSTFLRIEAERAAAAELAVRHGLSLAEVFALRDLVGVEAVDARWHEAVGRYAAAGGGAEGLLGLGADPALTQRRFAMLRERFAARDAAR